MSSRSMLSRSKSSRSMSSRTIIAAAAALVLGVASLSTDALAFRGGARGVGHVGHYGNRGRYGYHGGYAYRRGYWRPGVGVGAAAVGAAALGAAAAGSYYNSAACGDNPNPSCY